MPNGEQDFWDWVLKDYGEEYVTHLKSEYGSADLARLRAYFLQYGAAPAPFEARAPSPTELYKQKITDWFNTAVQLGVHDREAGLEHTKAAFERAERTGVESAPYYKQILAKEDPAVFWQRQARGTFPGGYGLREFYAPKEEYPLRPGVPPKRAIPPIPTAGEAYYPFLETAGMTPAMKRYYEQRLTPMYAGFLAESPEAREAWWRGEHRTKLQFLGYPTKLEGVTVPTELRKSMPQYERVGVEPKGLPDPFLTHLEKYPFLEKFLQVPPRERGFRPSRFSPPTRWLGY